MSCFFSHAGRTAIPVLLSVALAAAACNKDGEITLPDSKPRITLDSETGVYAAKIGRAVTITPTVENEGEAAYSWTIDDEVVSTARVFEYVFNEEGRVYVTLRVENRAGYDEKEARIDVNRLAPPVISLIVPPTGLYVLTGREYTFAPEVQNGENARYEWYLDDSSVPVSTEKDYIFMRTQPGDCSLRLTVTNEDGTAEKTVAVHVVDVIPVRIAFIPSSYLADPLVRSVSLGRTLFLRPQVSDAVGPEYAWYVNGVLQEDATQRMFAFTPEKEGEYEVTFRVTDTDESPAAPLSRHITRASSKRITEKTLRVTCYKRESERVITTTGQPASNRVLEFLPAPGQFVNVELDGCYLRRPISVCDWDERTITLIYKVVGEGTALMAGLRPGARLDLLTGLGNGFDVTKGSRRELLVGGGVGVPPLYNLAKRLLADGREVAVVLGFNTAAEVFYEEEFRALGCEVAVSTVDGSRGVGGFVTTAIAERGLDFDYFYACGPLPMLHALYNAVEQDGQLSFEERMGCGFGACMGCSCKTKYGYKRICKEGPVLTKDEIIW